MISVEVEVRIALYYFRNYLPDEIMMEIEEKLLPFYLEDVEPSDDDMVKLALTIIESALEE
jgi:hypothetical protein